MPKSESSCGEGSVVLADTSNGEQFCERFEDYSKCFRINIKSKIKSIILGAIRRVTSGGAHLHVLAPGLHSFEEMSQR